jgi:quercetin dioxygenase-like cupin family protein
MTIQAVAGVAPSVKVVQPGAGRAGGLAPGVGVVFKIDGAATGGAISIVEHPFEVGALVPPHIHQLEDEVSIVLEGEIGFRSNDQEVVLGPGAYIVKPRGEVHAMWNAGASRARMIEVISSAGFEGFFEELTEMTSVGRPDPAAVRDLAARYSLPFAQPEWLPDVVARYHLTPPAG